MVPINVVNVVNGANGANGANGDITDTKWSHVHPRHMAKQHPKRSQNGAEMELIKGVNGATN